MFSIESSNFRKTVRSKYICLDSTSSSLTVDFNMQTELVNNLKILSDMGLGTVLPYLITTDFVLSASHIAF